MQERTEYNFIWVKKQFPTQRRNFLYFSTKKSIFWNEKKNFGTCLRKPTFCLKKSNTIIISRKNFLLLRVVFFPEIGQVKLFLSLIHSHGRMCIRINIFNYMKNLKCWGPFLWMGFNCFQATEPLRGGSLLFTTQAQRVPGTHLINLERMKGWAEFGAAHWFWSRDS